MFIDIQFPPYISYGSSGGPTYLTTVTQAAESGVEYRNAARDIAICRWDASFGIMSQADLTVVLKFFRLCKGKAHSFRYKDWADFQVTEEEGWLGTAEGDGTTTVYQLYKRYAVGGVYSERKILKPVPASVMVLVSGAAAEATVDYTTGVVTFDVAPADGALITWTGEFDVPARFDTDEMKQSIDDFQMSSWGQVPIVEVLVP